MMAVTVKASWKDAAIWALAAAMILELGINLFTRQTVWHRITAIEERVSVLERLHARDDERMRQKLEEREDRR